MIIVACALTGCARLYSLFGIDEGNDATSLELCNIQLEYDLYQYTGEPIEPTVIATYSSVSLVLDTDYTVSYSNNIEVGTATATVTGKGKYKGEVVLQFEIAPEVYTYNHKCSNPE